MKQKQIDDINKLLDKQRICAGGNTTTIFNYISEIKQYETKRKKPTVDWLMFRAYTLGFIMGKRAERKHRAETEEARELEELKRLFKTLHEEKPFCEGLGVVAIENLH